MPRKIRLTWQPGADGRRGRWKKKYKGRTLYLGTASSKSDIEAYKSALAEWETRKSAVDAEEASRPKPHQADYEQAIAEWTAVSHWSDSHGESTLADEARMKIDSLRDRSSQKSPSPLQWDDRFLNLFEIPPAVLDGILTAVNVKSHEPIDTERMRAVFARMQRPSSSNARKEAFAPTPMQIEKAVWKDRIETANQPASLDTQVSTHLDHFFADEQSRVRAGALSAGRFTSKRTNLLHFVKWFGGSRDVGEIDGQAVLAYRQSLLAAIAKQKLARATAHTRLQDACAFIRRLWRLHAIADLPRILIENNRELAIGKDVRRPLFFTIDEVKTCLAHANDRVRLYLLLMLNCGMYQGDISAIAPEEVDWEHGTITRKRSKSAHHASAPSVRYLLWQDTLQLLRDHRESEGPLLLRNRFGNRLVVRDIRDNGKATTNDSVKNAYDRLKKKTGIEKPLKLLRKTSANLIANNPKFRGLENLFLGHSPSGTADRYYVDAAGQLDAAVTWLGTQYGVS
ncbi:tyrosine-type recombinase/integrase [Thalassoroseus pseudoceratinae]|uniref:tyrosine-type recombinase/integrase n=1 Tax=Thalassoroseus pseudoceratinae TaxID=2713176 RepID=UPI001420A115|nr:site-specific integrase [Thalassoroseus pseudoceratinae]